MNPFYRPNRSDFFATYLDERLEEAKETVSVLTKASFVHKTEEQVAESIVRQYKLTPLTLGKPTTRIEEQYIVRSVSELPSGDSFSLSHTNYRDLVHVVWQVGGSPNILGLRDSMNLKIQDPQNGQIKERYMYSTGLKNNPNAGESIKARIESDTAEYQGHIDRLNTALESFNSSLSGTIPSLVKDKYQAVNKLNSLEDFLNS